MAVLVPGQQYGLSSSSVQTENKLFVFVKLTDSSLKAIQEYSSLKDKKPDPTIEFSNNQGAVHIPGGDKFSNRDHSFNFSLTLTSDIEGPHGSLECIHQSYRSLESAGCMQFRMHIQAKDDVYETTRSKLAAVEEENKKMCTKVIKESGPHVGRKGRTLLDTLPSRGNNKLPFPTRKPGWSMQQNGHADKIVRRPPISSSLDSARLHDSSNLDNPLKRNGDMSLDLARKKSRPLPPRPNSRPHHSEPPQPAPVPHRNNVENGSNHSDFDSVFNSSLGAAHHRISLAPNKTEASANSTSHHHHHLPKRLVEAPERNGSNAERNNNNKLRLAPPVKVEQNGATNAHSPGVLSEASSLSSPEIRQNDSENGDDESRFKVTEYLQKFTPIQNTDQRARYKGAFNGEYAEYITLHGEIESVSLRFASLKDRLKAAGKGTQEWRSIKEQILTEYDKNKKDLKYQEAKRRFDFLHKKLSHIKQLVIEFDNNHQNQTDMMMMTTA